MSKISSLETLRYTQEMLRELVQMAKADRNRGMAYLMEMAYMEACDQIRAIHSGNNNPDIMVIPSGGRRRTA